MSTGRCIIGMQDTPTAPSLQPSGATLLQGDDTAPRSTDRPPHVFIPSAVGAAAAERVGGRGKRRVHLKQGSTRRETLWVRRCSAQC